MVRHPNWGHPDRDACGTGFVTYLGRPASHEIVRLAQTALERLTHRGGVDADGASGDGAGLLLSLPQPFFRRRAQELGISLAPTFGVGFAFFSSGTREVARAAVEYAATLERLRIVGWRRVPTEPECLGRLALQTMPEFWQFFVESFHPDRATGGF